MRPAIRMAFCSCGPRECAEKETKSGHGRRAEFGENSRECPVGAWRARAGRVCPRRSRARSHECGCEHVSEHAPACEADLLARTAGIFGPAHHEHAELRWDDIEPFAPILTDPMKDVSAAGTGVIIDIDHHLDARQMRRKRAPVHPALCGAARALGRGGGFLLGFAMCCDLLNVF